MKTLQPPGWAPPKGYANGVAARGTVVFVGGQIGWNALQQFESDDFVAQARCALQNIVAVLAEAAQTRFVSLFQIGRKRWMRLSSAGVPRTVSSSVR